MTPSSSNSKSGQTPVLPLYEERGAKAGKPPSYELQPIDSGIAAQPASSVSPTSEFTPASSRCATPAAPPRAVTAAASDAAAPVHEAVQERRRPARAAASPATTEETLQFALALLLGLVMFLLGGMLAVAIIFGIIRLLKYIFR